MKSILILGNDNLCKESKQFVKEWKEEIWGFNFRFLDKSIQFSKIFVDNLGLFKAQEYKREFGKNFDILCNTDGSNLNLFSFAIYHALTEEYKNIYICGINLGRTNHEKKNKANWIRDLQKLSHDFNFSDNIYFIENDYDGIIQEEVKLYGETIYNDFSNKVLILGNGVTRTEEPDISFIQNWKGELWGCNHAYKEDLPFTRIGVLDKKLFREIQNYKSKKFSLYSTRGNNVFYYNDRKGNTGYFWILQALYEGFDKIFLSGFDFGGGDLYTKYKSGVSFRRRFQEIIDEFGLDRICFVRGYPDFLV